jgi:outer membrane protein
MSIQGRFQSSGFIRKSTGSIRSDVFETNSKKNLIVILIFTAIFLLTGCVSDKTDEKSVIVSYQQVLAERGPQQRVDAEGKDSNVSLGLLRPVSTRAGTIPDVEIIIDPNSGQHNVPLTIEQAIARTLANSPEIRVVSFDPSIAKQDITRAAAEFDVTAFGDLNFENEDNPQNSIYQSGQSDERTLEAGVKQKSITGSEWSLSYAMTRSWDDLSGRTLSTRYEPILGFQLRQPLLRDAWQEVTLAGVDVAKLNYKISLLQFRQKAEETAIGVISAYWRLLQARRDLEIHQKLLANTLETLEKVISRREIDATELHIKQTEASAKTREAALIQARKRIYDAQDVLIRLMADAQLNVLEDFNIIPATEPIKSLEMLEESKLLELALNKNPIIQQARIGIEIADINIRVAENQDMPRLDLTASARTQGLAKGPENAQERLYNGDYVSYGLGLSLEYPLGNRQREAELIQRRFERRQAFAILHNVADQAAQLVRERTRRAQTNYSEIQVQKDAIVAAQDYLEAMEETENIREQMTPEFLLVKLQAQEVLANAQMAQVRATVEFNIALAELAQTLGTVLELHQVEPSLLNISSYDSETNR